MSVTTDRKHQTVVRIQAPADRVWRALTEAEEITNWFAPRAEVDPGKSGSIVLQWGELRIVCRIHEWQPGRLLRASWCDPDSGSTLHGPGPSITEFTLRTDGDATVLKLVHSGFGTGPEWDKEYDGTRRGWKYELGSLQHYLERHPGKPRRMSWARRPITVSREEAWNRLMTRGLGAGNEKLAEGEHYSFLTAAGERLEGTVRVYEPPLEFAGTVDNMDGALLRISIEDCFAVPEADIWLSTWGEPGDVEVIEERWSAMLSRLFPE